MPISNIFIDESGTPYLSSASTAINEFYVIGCISSFNDNTENTLGRARDIVRSHAGDGELKSSNIGGDIERRNRILQDINEANFGIYALVVNKTRIFKESGLRFDTSSYKFLHSMVFSHLDQAFGEIHILADQYRDSDFMEEFKEYVGQKLNMFNSVSFAPSTTTPILQIADVVAGSIRRVFEGKDDFSTLEQIGYPALPLEFWPPEGRNNSIILIRESDSEKDQKIQLIALKIARSFIEENISNNDPEMILQVRTLRYLLSKFYQNPNEYHCRAEIVGAITESGQTLSPESLSRTVIAKLRSVGVVLVSTESGIKIPSGNRDIEAWLDRISSQVVPYFGRLEKTRNAILTASENDVDILTPQHEDLQQYVLGRARMRVAT